MMQVAIIDNPNQFPQFEARNVFQTKEWMRLFEHEKGTKVVLFAVHKNILQETNKECSAQNCSPELGELPEAEGSVNSQLSILSPKAQRPSVLNSQLVLVQPVVIQRFVKWLPWRLGAYAVAWREPWRAQNITDEEAVKAFRLLTEEIEKYCRKRALYVEYRHFSDNNIYGLNFNSQLLTFNSPWYNIYRGIEAGEDVVAKMKRDKKRQLKQSFEVGVEVVLAPTREQIVEWYGLLKRLYRRIHRPLPSVDLFLRLNESEIGRVFVVTYRGRVVSGGAMLFHSSLLTSNSPLFYEWYRASIDERIEGVYPSVVATWQAMQLVADMGGGRFDFMGAGRRDKEYGVRQFKLEFGGELTPEYRYRKYFLF